MSPLDESALRRPEFVEGDRIRLCDGQEWSFPRPIVEIYAVPGDDGIYRFEGMRRRRFGPDFDRKLDAFAATAGKTYREQLESLLQVAVDLLGRNYDLKPADFGELLAWRRDDESNDDMWRAIAEVAGGFAPKADAVGSG